MTDQTLIFERHGQAFAARWSIRLTLLGSSRQRRAIYFCRNRTGRFSPDLPLPQHLSRLVLFSKLSLPSLYAGIQPVSDFVCQSSRGYLQSESNCAVFLGCRSTKKAWFTPPLWVVEHCDYFDQWLFCGDHEYFRKRGLFGTARLSYKTVYVLMFMCYICRKWCAICVVTSGTKSQK